MLGGHRGLPGPRVHRLEARTELAKASIHVAQRAGENDMRAEELARRDMRTFEDMLRRLLESALQRVDAGRTTEMEGHGSGIQRPVAELLERLCIGPGSLDKWLP